MKKKMPLSVYLFSFNFLRVEKGGPLTKTECKKEKNFPAQCHRLFIPITFLIGPVYCVYETAARDMYV